MLALPARGGYRSQDDPLKDARRHLVSGQHGSAEATSRAFLAAHPGHAEALHILGAALIGLQRPADAVAALQKAAQLTPADTDLSYKLGLALYLDGRHDDAIGVFRGLLARTPTNPRAHFRVGLIHHQNADFERATVCYRRALALDPTLTAAQDCLDAAQAGLFFGAGSGFQGAHAPARQVFLSAAVYARRSTAAPLRILEVGSYMGSSALTWAHAIDRFIDKGGSILCVDPWAPGPMYAFDDEMNLLMARSDGAYQAFQRNAQRAPKSVTITHRRGLSHEILPTLPDSSFDIVYIDGSHYHEDVAADISEARRLVCDGGFVCGDDLELQAAECDLEHARRHPRADFIPDPRSGTPFHPGVTVAVHDSLGPVSAYNGFWIMARTGAGFARVDLTGCEAVLPSHWPRRLIDELRRRFSQSRELHHVHD
jgi:tetratricopeptide (TPR) repeat protein